MSLFRASILLVTASVKNRVKRQLVRLRQPRYLAATALGVLYFWNIFLRNLNPHRTLGGSITSLSITEFTLVGLALLAVIAAWVLGGEEGALRFTEAEAQFFFPAPVTRRTLLHYKMGRTLSLTAVSSGFMTLLMGMRVTAHAGFFWAGAWLGLGTLSMHLTAASLTRASLLEHGFQGLRRRIVTLVVAVGVLAALVAFALRSVALPGLAELTALEFGRWTANLMNTAPLSWVLYPIRAALHVALAQTLPTFLSALPGAVAVMAVHYVWVISSDVAFEEGSVAAAEQRGRSQTNRRGGRFSFATRRIPAPFRLFARGRPEVALVWKNLIAALRERSIQFVILLALLSLSFGIFAFSALGQDPWGQLAAAGLVCAAIAVFLSVLGPPGLADRSAPGSAQHGSAAIVSAVRPVGRDC